MTGQTHTRRVAAILCLIPAAYFLATAGYGLLNFADYASDTPRLIRYVVGPLGIVAILAIVAVFVEETNALVVGITATALLAALFVFESYMTYRVLPRQMGLVGAVDDGVSLERFRNAMPPAYTIKALNKERGVETLDRAVLASVPGEEVFLCSRGGAPVSYRADRFGFRNPVPAAAPPIDVLVLGDSFMEGICLDDGAHTVDQLRGSGLSVVNTASRGAGPLFELAVLGRYGPYFRPDVTLMVFFAGNDWENLLHETAFPWLAQAFEPDADFGPVEWTEDQLAETAEIVDTWWQGTAASTSELFQRRAVLRNFFALQQTASVLGLHYPKKTPQNPEYERTLRRAAEIVDGWDGRLVVAYVPPVARYGGMFDHKFVHEPLHRMVLEAAGAAGVPVVDLTGVFDAQPDPRALYAADSHFNPAGARLAAEIILDYLETSGMVPQ
ncbi:MAG: hypothetical protein KDK53_03475 [Maritimibacter sp.]|nr:hypothetical protein [Maritimibacter sp.]